MAHQIVDRETPTRYQHIYLAPHFDDAVLSCGATIAQQSSRGDAILVLTICGGLPPAGTVFSAFASQMHASWGLAADEVVARRRHEERAALQILGADSCWLDYLDAIYRLPEVYTSDAALFGEVVASDPLQHALAADLARLLERYPTAQFYAPLGVGRHVDHQIAHQAAFSCVGMQPICYEDYPYAQIPGMLEQRLADLAAIRPMRARWQPARNGLERKITALRLYVSQLDLLFGGADSMAEQVAAYAAQIGSSKGEPCERFWIPDSNGSVPGT